MDRRQALVTLAISGIALKTAHSQSGGMICRTFGRTGREGLATGVGGAHTGCAASAELASSSIRAAVDRGAERRMGAALRDGYRQKVFATTQFGGRGRYRRFR